MSFNPALPLPDSEMKSAEMRSQFLGLKDLIDVPETDPVFLASEAALLEPGDKAKLDSALQPGSVTPPSLNEVLAANNDAGGESLLGVNVVEAAFFNGPGGSARPVLQLGFESQAPVIMAGLPTSDPHLANALWNDAGTLKISAG